MGNHKKNSVLLPIKIFVGCLCAVFTFSFVAPMVSAQDAEQKAIRVNDKGYSYAGNVKEGKVLYDEESEKIINKYTPVLPRPALFLFIKGFLENLRSQNPQIFDILLWSSIAISGYLQLALAAMLRQRQKWKVLGYYFVLGLLIMSSMEGENMVALPGLLTLGAIFPIWQLLDMGHVSFVKTFFANLLFLFALYGATVYDIQLAQTIIFAMWGIYAFGIYFRVLSEIAFKSSRSSWISLLTFIPLTGFPLYFLTCIRGIQIKERINPKFVNVILKLLNEGKNRNQIRDYALKANIRMNYFDHHFISAFREYEKAHVHISPSLYFLRLRLTLLFLVIFTVVNVWQFSVSAQTLKSYYKVWNYQKYQDQLLTAIQRDNRTYITKLYESRDVNLNPNCEDGWKNCLPLYEAMENDNVRSLETLIDLGANPNPIDNRGIEFQEIVEEQASPTFRETYEELKRKPSNS